ncbi:hypothetical protein [Chryseobacterium sp. JK1]|uniref:hypothetical protein n=1 Tax=Chryseobacterium sp. JK1 TaxID=874294 RepID=UPI003D69E41C
MEIDNTKKYLHFKYNDKTPLEIVAEMTSKGATSLYVIKEIKNMFPTLSLTEAKEVVVIATSEYKSLYDYQGNLFKNLEDFDEETDE